MKKEEKYYGTNWTPEGWNKKEWQEIWRKLWLLSKEEVRTLAKKLGTYFTDEKIQKKQDKLEGISPKPDIVVRIVSKRQLWTFFVFSLN